MIIGVDAGALSITDNRLKVGVWRVVVNLLTELGRLDATNTYRLYSFAPIDEGILAILGPRMVNVVLPQKGWFRFWLPLELMRHPVDRFLGLSQAIPSFTKNSIGFIYDLGFLHFPDAYPASYNALKNQTEYLVKHSDHIVTISHTTEQDLLQKYSVSKNRMSVCYPGVSSQFTVSSNRYTSKRPYFLFVGALKRGKNIPVLLEAFAQFLSKTQQECDLYLVGGNYWLDPAIDETIEKLSLKNRVKSLGVVTDETLASLYRGAWALVVPSLWEGFCLPVTEAMASGCPVIVSGSGSLPEITGDAGIIVRGNAPEAYASAMKRMATDKAFRKECAKKGLKQSKLFSWETMAQKVFEIINRV